MATPILVPATYSHDPFLAVQHALAVRWLDPVMKGVSWTCGGWVLAFIALALTCLVERRRRTWWVFALPMATVLVVDGAAVQFLKHALDLPRPLAVLGADHVRVLVAPLRSHSMPSGHASAAAAAASFELRHHRRAGLALAALALVGGISRVYVGAHWVLDVAVGWAVGAFIGLTVAALTRALARRLARLAPALAATAASGR